MINDYSEALVELKPLIKELEKALQNGNLIKASILNSAILRQNEELLVWIEAKVRGK